MLTKLWTILRLRRRFYSWSPEQTARYQERRLRHLVRLAVARSPYFRRLYAGCDLSRPLDLPKTNKKEMMRHLGEYNTAGLDGPALLEFCVAREYDRDFLRRYGRYTVGLSSGTSGAKGVIVLSPAEKRLYSCIVAARHGVPDHVRPLRVLFFLRVNSAAFEEVNRVGIRLRYLDMMAPLPEIFETMRCLEPTVLAAPPSLLSVLAEEAEAGRLPSRPRCVVSYAEVLEPEARVRFEAAFEAPVVEIYQASEGFIGSTCRAGRLHVNEDLVLVQTEPVEGYPALDGLAPGRVVVSDLTRVTLPFLRYELDDLVILDSERCPCGSSFRVIRRVLGRCDDVFVLPAAEGGTRKVYADYVSRAVIRAAEGILEYQVEQCALDRVVVRLEPEKGVEFQPLSAAVSASLSALFLGFGCKPPALDVRPEPPSKDENSRKLRRIRRTFTTAAEDAHR